MIVDVHNLHKYVYDFKTGEFREHELTFIKNTVDGEGMYFREKRPNGTYQNGFISIGELGCTWNRGTVLTTILGEEDPDRAKKIFFEFLKRRMNESKKQYDSAKDRFKKAEKNLKK